MNRKFVIIAAMILVFVVVVIGIASLGGPSNGNSSGSRSANSNKGATLTDPNVIVVRGTVRCLTGTAQSGQVQAQGCGVAITTENGEVFSISSQDPNLTKGLAIGQHIEVTGSRGMSDEESGTDGVLEATAIKKL